MREGLQAYIESEIIPRYRYFDKAHREEHARSVIAQALELARYYEVDPDLVYAAAAYHDTGLAVDRATHHLESGKVIRADRRLREWFTADEIETIAEAAEDHRASAKTVPRSIYGRLIAEADRLIDPMTITGNARWSTCARSTATEAISSYGSRSPPMRRGSNNSAGSSGNRKPCGACLTSFLRRRRLRPSPTHNHLILTAGQPKSW